MRLVLQMDGQPTWIKDIRLHLAHAVGALDEHLEPAMDELCNWWWENRPDDKATAPKLEAKPDSRE